MDTDKKIEIKRRRFAARLKCSKGIICSKEPEKNLILCNVGQATGMEKEVILKCINTIAAVAPNPKYIAEKGETHSYLTFDCKDAAIKVYEQYNGVLKLPQSDLEIELVIYLAYVETVPNDETIYNYEYPKGLHLLKEFLSKEEEQDLINSFDIVDIDQCLKNRQVKHYGFAFRYGSNDVDLNAPLDEKIPEICSFIWPRLICLGIDVPGAPDQLTVNKYMPGQGIPSHVDKHSPFGPIILSLSLGSSVLMDWRHSGGEYIPVHIPAGSMLVMTGESRYNWQHGIQPKTRDPVLEDRTTPLGVVRVMTSDTCPRGVRLSLTFRWTREGPCQCQYKTLCDTVKNNIEDKTASKLEDLYVHEVYEQIACHFSLTRHKPWPKVVEFMKNVPPGSIVLDLGCGNGKNIFNRNDVFQIAGERSSGLLDECKRYINKIGNSDCLRLDLLESSLVDECADYIICIAVIHHFSNRIRRIQALSTIGRLLRKGGKALVTVWAKDQTKSNYLDKAKDDINIGKTHETVDGINLPVHENRTQFQHSDLLVPWKLRQVKNKSNNETENTLLRYYHVFEESELDSLCCDVASLKIVTTFYEEGNWCVICEKI